MDLSSKHGVVAVMSASFIAVEIEYLLRILLSAFCGALIGLEREKRAKNAGIRTHILVAISSALMMIVSKYGFYDVITVPGISLDASRIAAGVVTAIGFLGAGVIFVRKENTVGLTTSAGLWATVGMGITIGAGLYFTGMMFTLFILLLQFMLHSHFSRTNNRLVARLTLLIAGNDVTLSEITKKLGECGLCVMNAELRLSKNGALRYTGIITMNHSMTVSALLDSISRTGIEYTVETPDIK